MESVAHPSKAPDAFDAPDASDDQDHTTDATVPSDSSNASVPSEDAASSDSEEESKEVLELSRLKGPTEAFKKDFNEIIRDTCKSLIKSSKNSKRPWHLVSPSFDELLECKKDIDHIGLDRIQG